MTRSRPNVSSRERRKKILKKSKGYYSSRSKTFRVAKQSVIKAGQYSYIDRHKKKRNLRKLWILKINAAVRKYKLNYSKFIFKLKEKNININRKILSNNIIINKNYLTELINNIN